MEYKSVLEQENSVVIKDVQNFNLRDIFECGQCFRWNVTDKGTYIGVANGKVIEIEKKENDVIIYNINMEEFQNLWSEYFDLNTSYANIIEELSKDPLLKKACDFGDGIRILKQDPFEITLSFIISANNRIPMIKRAIKNISEKWGEKIIYNQETYYTFPTLESLSKVKVEELESCGVGFRAKYLYDTIQKLYNNEENLESIKILEDEECHKAMQKFNGIGPKVSDCIILFSMQKYSAFPVDVWVKRAMMHFYVAPDVSLPKIRAFGRNKFGELAGFAQQYLFYYARENDIKV